MAQHPYFLPPGFIRAPGASPNGPQLAQVVAPPAAQTPANLGRFQFTNQTLDAIASPDAANGIVRYLEQGISVEVATVPQLAAAMTQYATENPDGIVGVIASLAAVYREHAVKIAEAGRLAFPHLALEIAIAIAAAVPEAAIGIVVAFAAADPSLAPMLAGLILPAAGGINQTSAAGFTRISQTEMILRNTPANTSGSPTGGP